MPERNFEGFAGISIAADAYGQEEDPCVLLIPSAGQSRRTWHEAAEALAAAGRYVVSIDLRGHGDSERPADGRYDLDAYVGDLCSILAKLSSRPVIVGASLGGWIATAALGEGGPDIASGLVLVDSPPRIDPDKAREVGQMLRSYAERRGDSIDFDPHTFEGMDLEDIEERLAKAASALKLPTLIVRGAQSELSSLESIKELTVAIADAEAVEIEGAGHLVATEQAEAFNAVLLEFLERRIPREPPEYQAGSDSRTLRDALGCFATGVTVVTTAAPDGTPVGLTANSFTSVSLEPEILLVCLAKTASCLSAFDAAEHFAVNVLHIGQQPLSNRFAMKGEDRFAETDWESWSTGAPIIKGTLASFECEKYQMQDVGDHVILLGKVSRVRFEPRRDPLLYFRGKYRRLHFA
jgi:flavin reductase (DIM6/NTAB) family NADH-FMN oxidoreductase RutF/pimeloyl-ACP methyl ester carboxylesterase